MMRSALIALCCLLALTGCASIQHWLHPSAAGHPAVAGANPRLDAYAIARAAEITRARRAADEMLAATAGLAPARQVRSSAVKTATQHVVDRKTREARDVEVLDSVVADVPLALRGSTEHDAVMEPVSRLATWLAAQRGGAGIDRAYASADARSEKIKAQSGSAKTAEGEEVTVRKLVDTNVPAGFERINVHGADLPPEI